MMQVFGFMIGIAAEFHRSIVRPVQEIARACLGDAVYEYVSIRLREMFLDRAVSALVG